VFTVVRGCRGPFEIKDFYIERTVYFTLSPLIPERGKACRNPWRNRRGSDGNAMYLFDLGN
jgi:hypothetical protein